MLTATLLCAPGSGALTPQIVEVAKTKMSGSAPVWLSDDACDIEVAHWPDPDAPCLWQALQEDHVDIVLQPTEGRRKRLLLADMDSTMIQQECIDELAIVAGVGDRVFEITTAAMNGEINFEEALLERVELLEDLPVAMIEHVLSERITLMPGGPELVATMKAHGAYAALVSGGFTDFTAAIAARLGFDEHRANTLLRDGDRLTGAPGRPILGKEAKVEALEDITDCLGISTSDAIAVGDGANDLGMLMRAGTGVAVHAKPAVAAVAKMKLNFADLTGVLYVQGYAQSDFAKIPNPATTCLGTASSHPAL